MVEQVNALLVRSNYNYLNVDIVCHSPKRF